MAETRLGPWGPDQAQPLQTTPGSAGRRRPETPRSPWLARSQDFIRRHFRRRREEGRGGEGRGWSGWEDGG
jgi:hypothetical protein